MKNEKKIIWVFIAGAIVFRLLLLKFRYAVSFDEPHYLQMAVSLSRGDLQGFLHPYWSPGYPFFAGLFSVFIKNYEFAGRLVNILAGSLLLYPVYVMSRRLFNRKISVLSAIFLAFYPPLAFFNTTVMAESVYMLFAFSGIWLAWKALDERKWWNALAAGICWGITYLAKPEGIGFLLVFLAFSFLYSAILLIRKKPFAQVWIALLAPVGFLVPASGYLIYLHQEAGYWTLSAKGVANQQFEAASFTEGDGDVFDKLNDNNTSHLMDEIFHAGTFLKNVKTSGTPIKISPKLLLKKFVTNFFRVIKYAIPSFLSLPILVLLSLGLFGRVTPKTGLLPAVYLLAFLIFYWFCLVPLFHINDRYLLTMFPAATIWVAAGFFVMKDVINKISSQFELQTGIKKQFGLIFSLGFILFLAFVPEFGKILQNSPDKNNIWNEPLELKIAGNWIKAHTEKEAPVILSYNKAVDFYAGNYNLRSGVSFSKDPSDKIIAYAKYKYVDFFIVDERYYEKFPTIQQWISTSPPEELILVHEIDEPNLPRVWIFTWSAGSMLTCKLIRDEM